MIDLPSRVCLSKFKFIYPLTFMICFLRVTKNLDENGFDNFGDITLKEWRGEFHMSE